MKKSILTLGLLLSFTLVFTSCKEGKHESEHHNGTEMHESDAANDADMAMNFAYQCPMDCEEGKTYDEEGECPKCKMALKKVEKDGDQHDENPAHDHDGDGKSDH